MTNEIDAAIKEQLHRELDAARRERDEAREALIATYDALIPQAMPWINSTEEKVIYAGKVLPSHAAGVVRLSESHSQQLTEARAELAAKTAETERLRTALQGNMLDDGHTEGCATRHVPKARPCDCGADLLAPSPAAVRRRMQGNRECSDEYFPQHGEEHAFTHRCRELDCVPVEGDGRAERADPEVVYPKIGCPHDFEGRCRMRWGSPCICKQGEEGPYRRRTPPVEGDGNA